MLRLFSERVIRVVTPYVFASQVESDTCSCGCSEGELRAWRLKYTQVGSARL
jgi:hypothetical protein